MATDYSLLTIKQLKAELASRGLDQIGKKAELIAKLESNLPDPQVKDDRVYGISAEDESTLLGDQNNGDEDGNEQVMQDEGGDGDADEDAENPQAGDEAEEQEDEGHEAMETQEGTSKDNEEEKTGAAKGSAEKSKDGSESAAKDKAKRWFQVVGARKAGKFRGFDIVQTLLNTKQREKVLGELRQDHKFRAYPFTVSDLSQPTFAELTDKCAALNMAFGQSVEAALSELEGEVTFTVRKKGDAKEFLSALEAFKPSLKITHMGAAKNFSEAFKKFKNYRTGCDMKHEETTLLIPHLPDNITEDDLWDMFPAAWEIMTKKSEKDKKSFALLYFPNMEVSQKATRDLSNKPPVKGLQMLELVPLKFITDAARPANTGGQGTKMTSIFSPTLVTKQPKAAPRIASAQYAQHAQSNKMGRQGRGHLPQQNRPQQGSYQGNRQKPNFPSSNQPNNRRFQQQSRQEQRPFQSPRQAQSAHGRFQGASRVTPLLDQTPSFQPQRQPSEQARGLNVLGNLLSSISGGQGNEGQAAGALLRMLGNHGNQQQQQQFAQNTSGGRREQFMPQDQGMQRSPKRAGSPDFSAGYNKRMRHERQPGQESSAGLDYMQDTQDYSSHGQPSAGGYSAQYQAKFNADAGGYAQTSHQNAGQPSTDRQMFDSLNVVSRIARASKELRKTSTKREQQQGYSGHAGQQANYQGSGNTTGYESQTNYYQGNY